jgi:hypothetical protein
MGPVVFGYNHDWRPGYNSERIGLLRLTKRSTRAAGWALFEARLIGGGRVTTNVSQPNPDRDFRAVSWVRLMALRLEDRAMATSFVTMPTVDSLSVIWLCGDKLTPDYPCLG